MVPVPGVPMIVIVIASVALIMIAPMILIMIVVFRLALILLVLVMVIIAFASESCCGKHQSTCYRAHEREFANHLVVLCQQLGTTTGVDSLALINFRTADMIPLLPITDLLGR